jgi:tetratricopeptide (TPR) repeat protein
MTVLVYAGYAPKPVQKSLAEIALQNGLDAAKSDSEKVVIAKAALEANPEDVRLSANCGNVLRRYMDDAEAYFKTRAEGSESIAKRYVNAILYGDSTKQTETSAWILKKDANNYWGHRLAALGEWEKATPNMEKVRSEFEAAIAADPSQPDGYLYLGYALDEMERQSDALAAYEAGAVSDPTNSYLRNARMTIYATQRKADQYFALLPDVLPKEPVSMTLASANAKEGISPEVLKRKMTLLEFWGFS